MNTKNNAKGIPSVLAAGAMLTAGEAKAEKQPHYVAEATPIVQMNARQEKVSHSLMPLIVDSEFIRAGLSNKEQDQLRSLLIDSGFYANDKFTEDRFFPFLQKIIGMRNYFAGTNEQKAETLKTLHNLAVTDKGWDFIENTSFDKPFSLECEWQNGAPMQDTLKMIDDAENSGKQQNDSLKWDAAMDVYWASSEKDRGLLGESLIAIQEAQKRLNFDDYKMLLDKWKTAHKFFSGTDAQKKVTLDLLCALSVTKDGLDFIKKFDPTTPFRLETVDPSLLSSSLDNFSDYNGNLRTGTIRARIGNMPPIELNSQTMDNLLKMSQSFSKLQSAQKANQTNEQGTKNAPLDSAVLNSLRGNTK